ncbi:MAG: ATP synthase F1 subunit gamma, partial [Actinobacteria bacterium]
DRIENARPYALAMAEVLGNVVANVRDAKHPLLEVREERKTALYIAIASDRGLAGAFNSNIIRMTENAMRADREAGRDVRLITVGKKTLTYFRYRGVEPEMVLRDMSDKPTYAHARQIAAHVMSAYTDGEVDAVNIMFNRFKSVAEQSPENHQLLPIEQSVLSDAEKDVESRGLNLEYLFEPSSEAVLDTLLPAYTEALVYRALLESAAAEHGARRTAMKSATDNAGEMITTLTRSYNRARQAAITTEIAEIVGGAAALEED